jgi:hypothetical protein
VKNERNNDAGKQTYSRTMLPNQPSITLRAAVHRRRILHQTEVDGARAIASAAYDRVVRDDDVSRWPDIRIIRIDTGSSARYSALLDVRAFTSRPIDRKWSEYFEQSLALDPAERNSNEIQAQRVPMIWASRLTSERAETVVSQIREAVEVANLRYRTQHLPRLPPGERADLVSEALRLEAR